jgi:Domain of unknown function (DUF4352)
MQQPPPNQFNNYPQQQQWQPQQDMPPRQQWLQPYPPQYQPPMPPPPPPKKSHKGLFIVLGVIPAIALLACVGISALVLAGGNAAQQTLNQTSTQVSQQITQAVQPTTAPTQANAPSPKVGVPYVVDVTVKNTSSSNQSVSSLGMFNFKDSTGQQYTETITTSTKPPDGTVTPGSLLRGQLVYEVPTSQHLFTFAFQADFGGTDLTEWNLSI